VYTQQQLYYALYTYTYLYVCTVSAGDESTEMPQLSAEKNQSAIVQFIAAFKRIGFGTQRGLSPSPPFMTLRRFPIISSAFLPPFFRLVLLFLYLQFKFLDKDEFHDVKRLTKVLLDGNQLSVVVDQLFRMQKSLNHLGEPILQNYTQFSFIFFIFCQQ